MTIEASGETVPAFTVTFAIAQPVELLTPVADGITKGAAFNVVWKPSAVKEGLNIALGGKDRRILCVTDTTQGNFSIGEEYVRAVSDYPQQDDSGNPVVGLKLTTYTSAEVRAGDYAVQALSNRTTGGMLAVR